MHAASKHGPRGAEKSFTTALRRGTAVASGMTSAAHASRSHTALALGLCAFAYLYVFPYQSRINNPNENVRFYMTAALVEEGRYAIDGMRERWGYVNDAATYGGQSYSVKAPGTSLLAVPGYALYYGLSRALERPFDRTEALWVCRITASVLPTLVWLFFLHRWLVRRARNAALREAVFFSVALGSLLYGYGMLLVSHTHSAAAAFGAFMLLSDARERGSSLRLSHAFFAGVLAALVTFFEYPGLPCSIALTGYAVYVLWPHGGVRALAAYATGGMIPALAMMHFHLRAFGNPFTPGHLFVENQAFRAAHHEGLYGAVGPSLGAIHGLLFDLGAGLFPLTPVLLLAPLGIVLLLRERRMRAEGLCIAAVLLFTVLAISSMNNWRGGWTIGPRYLALCVPFAAYAALVALERWAARTPRLAAGFALGATAVAMLASGVPSAYYPHLPPELTRPLPQLFAVLVAHDYAPRNAGALLSLHGTPSMLPWLLALLAALGLCLRAIASRAARVRVASFGALLAFCGCALLCVRPAREPGVSQAVAFVTRHWTPEGHDRAARLSAVLRGRDLQAQAQSAQRNRLAALYAREGRRDEADRILRGKL